MTGPGKQDRPTAIAGGERSAAAMHRHDGRRLDWPNWLNECGVELRSVGGRHLDVLNSSPAVQKDRRPQGLLADVSFPSVGGNLRRSQPTVQFCVNGARRAVLRSRSAQSPGCWPMAFPRRLISRHQVRSATSSTTPVPRLTRCGRGPAEHRHPVAAPAATSLGLQHSRRVTLPSRHVGAVLAWLCGGATGRAFRTAMAFSPARQRHSDENVTAASRSPSARRTGDQDGPLV